MTIPFDFFGNPERPDLSLCYLDGTPISPIFDPEDLELSFEFLNPHEISFRVYEKYQQDGEQKEWEFYKQVTPYKQVLAQGLGYYVITDVSENKEAENPYKDITATSCEITLGYKDINLSEGGYLLANPDDWGDPKTIVGMVSVKLPNWSFSHIDEELYGVTRFLDATEGNLYDFLKNTVEDRYGCIFQFDTLHHTISILDQNRDIEQADIFLSHDNFLESISIDYNNDEIFTALRATGGDDISIESVNPIGGSIIYQLDYFQHDMPEGLWEAISEWNQKIAEKQKPFSQAVLKAQKLNGEILQYEQDKIALESQQKTYEQIIELRKESDLEYEDVQQSLQETLTKIADLASKIQTKQQEMQVYKAQYEAIQKELAFSNNFTTQQIKQLDPFIIYGEFRDDNIITTSNMTYEDKQKQSQELYDRCVQALADTLVNKGSFDVDSKNFLFDSKFKPYADKLKLGAKVYIESTVGSYTPYLLVSYKYSYGRDSLSLSFNNLGISSSSLDTYAKLYGELNKSSSSIQNTLSSKANTTTIDEIYDELQSMKGQAEAILSAGELNVKRVITEYLSVENAKNPGKTIINGGNITTGILQSADGTTFFLDLDKGILKMKASSLSISGKTVEAIVKQAIDAQTQTDIFNKLTNNGQLQGLYMQDGSLYVNASYLKTGVLDAALVTITNLIVDHLVSQNGGFKLETWAAVSSLTNNGKLRLQQYCTANDEGLYQCFKGNVDSEGTLQDDKARYSYLTSESVGIGQDRSGIYQGTVYGKTISANNGASILFPNYGGIEFDMLLNNSGYYSFRMFCEQSGEERPVFRPDINGSGFLGTIGYRWNTGFFTNTITQSDLKDKENIALIPHAKEFIMQLRPIAYTLKDGDGKRIHMGFGAQEVAQTANQCQMGDLALYQASVIDEAGKERYYDPDAPDENLIWGLNYHEFLAPIVATIQEQQQEIEALKQEIRKIKEGII